MTTAPEARPSRFQSFTHVTDPSVAGPRLAALRAELARAGVDGVLVPRADAHQNEYVPPCDERLAWLLGFTGSAGVACVLAGRCALFVDGRYTLQAAAEVDGALVEVVAMATTPLKDWLVANLPAGARLGYDPWLHRAAEIDDLAEAIEAVGGELVPLAANPVDAVWADRPAPPREPVVPHELGVAGEATHDKLQRIRAALDQAKVGACVLSDPHAVAWTFNIRGADVAHTPLPLAWAIVPREGRPLLFIDGAKLSNAVRHLLEAHADIREPSDLPAALAELARGGMRIRLDPATGAAALARIVTDAGGRIAKGPDPVALLKAVKNDTEIAGARAAHRRDGAAYARFLAWFDREAPSGRLTEIDIVRALESFRAETGELREISFDTIAGAGPNGAIVHYRPTLASNRVVRPGDLVLVDSGAQYVDGTTDITRTIAVGEPTPEMRDRATRVLKGHIAIARAVFPQGTTGAQLDSFARTALWQAGLDYEHGTGHGVGSFLSVHEGPQRIAKTGTTPLQRGMILSNEPGYYKAGQYGIRIENLVLVVEGPPVEGAEKPLDAFETLTLAPIDRRTIAVDLLDAGEREWLDAYHARVLAEIGPLVDDSTRAWLAVATAPLR